MKNALLALAMASLPFSAVAGEPIEVTAPGPEGNLAGTMIKPEDGKPVVLIVPGSGPTDRDGNNPMGVTAAPYRMLAEALAKQGVGSIRADKRGMFGSSAAVANASDVTVDAYVSDVAAWAKVAKEKAGVDCVWVIGHSEGGLITLAAAQKPDNICGIVPLASVGRKLGDIIRQQLSSNPANAPILEQANATLASLEAGKRVTAEGMHPALMPLFNPGVQGYLIDMLSREPAAMAGKVTVPMLIIAGGKDSQTPVSDGEALAKGQPNAELLVIDNMNHVLKAVEGEGRAANLATYSNSALPVHPKVVEAIAEFVTAERD